MGSNYQKGNDMKKTIWLEIYILISISISAQTQQGFVKTLGRDGRRGTALSGVTIRVKGGHNSVLSNSDGTFSLLMIGKKMVTHTHWNKFKNWDTN